MSANFPFVTYTLVLCACYGMTTINSLETAWACSLLLILLRWFWWSKQPGIILFCLLIPFAEIHTPLLSANSAGLSLNDSFFGTGRKTFWLSSIGLLTVAFGVRSTWIYLYNNQVSIPENALKKAASQMSQRKLILGFIGASMASRLIDFAIPYASGYRQLEVYFYGISEVILFVIAIKFMLDRKNRTAIILLFATLIITSFYSFFSSWKDPFFILLVTALTTISRFNARQLLLLTPILAPAFILLLTWQTIKGEYRQFLNGGKYSQQVVVSRQEALAKFQLLASEAVLSNKIMSDESIDATYSRVGYLDYFANAVLKVPAEIPHQQGKLLTKNLEFVLLPRILFPDKGLKDDNAKVEKYTNFRFSQYGGSSFSLGHYCEAYIDWGLGMFIQLFFFGMLGGTVYMIASMRSASLNPLISLGIIWICIKPWGTFQQDMITMTGQVFWGTICHLLIFFPVYNWFNKWLQR